MEQPINILIVEDDTLLALTLEEILTKSGYRVCGKASSYNAAMDLIRNASPDLVIMDIDLNGEQQDGIVVARAILDVKSVPIIYLTGITEFDTFQRAKGTNPVAYLYKPFRPDELVIQIELALSNFYQGIKTEIITTTKSIYVPVGENKLSRVNYEGIYYIKAQKKYTEIFLTQQEAVNQDTRKTNDIYKPFTFSVGFGHLLSHLPDNFYKFSKSIAVNLDHLTKVDKGFFFIGPHEIEFKEGDRKLLLSKVNFVNSRKKKTVI